MRDASWWGKGPTPALPCLRPPHSSSLPEMRTDLPLVSALTLVSPWSRRRTQEWNASRKECMNLVRAGLLSLEDLEEVIISEFNPNRVTFKGGEDVWVNDILNVGVAPDKLVEKMKGSFLAAGGEVRELCEFRSATVYDDLAVLKVKDAQPTKAAKSEGAYLEDMVDVNKPNAVPKDESDGKKSVGRDTITCLLMIDCMGHFSPVVKQLRKGAKPDSIVLVVGGCITEGVPEFTSSDILASFTDASQDMQFFWETFPAKEGTTMYASWLAFSNSLG